MISLIPEMACRVSADRICEILERLIAFPTVNPPGDEGDIAAFVAGLMDEAGLAAETRNVAPGRPNVIARLETGKPGPTLVFNTHMDVVPPGEDWSRDPFVAFCDNGNLYGRGSVDAKGSLAAMLAALEVLAPLSSELVGTIVLTAVVDEESGSAGTKALFPGIEADRAIVGEPTSCRICTAHKGTSRPLIVIRGKSAHAAEPETGINAIEGAARVTLLLADYHRELKVHVHPLLGTPTAAVTIIKGGTKGNMIPDRCEIIISRRMIPGESEAVVGKELEAILAPLRDATPPVNAMVERFFETSGGPTETPADDPFVQLALGAAEEATGEKAGSFGFTPNCDMSRIRGAGIPTIILGPGLTEMAHQADEHVPISELERAAVLYGSIAAKSNGRR